MSFISFIADAELGDFSAVKCHADDLHKYHTSESDVSRDFYTPECLMSSDSEDSMTYYTPECVMSSEFEDSMTYCTPECLVLSESDDSHNYEDTLNSTPAYHKQSDSGCQHVVFEQGDQDCHQLSRPVIMIQFQFMFHYFITVLILFYRVLFIVSK